MTDKCKKLRGGALQMCEEAEFAWSTGFIERQALRSLVTGARRERMALRKGRTSMELPFCPFCRANVDTSPKEAA
ncbi:hypothetical protein ABEW79_25565 [Delftia tsuruhatensis]|uniref:hypothetical protein n=1 Tax=Delftia tsuruhatensis TaxID=180282 RepID=UPI003D24FC8D